MMPTLPGALARFKVATFSGRCKICRAPFTRGATILWCPDTRYAWCADCGEEELARSLGEVGL